METRKIQMVGGGTYTVSLPKAWAESVGVSTGDAVTLHSHIDGVLVVEPGTRDDDALGRVTVPVADDDPERLEQTVRAAYSAGFGEIVLDATGTLADDQQRAIERATSTLSGAIVDEQDRGRVTVRSLLEPSEISVRQSVRQLEYLALSMHEDATAALVDGVPARPPAGHDDQADRLSALVDRHFVRGLARLDEVDALGLTRPELFVLRTATRELGRIADRAEEIGTRAAGTDEPVGASVGEDIHDIGGAARSLVEEAVGVVVGDSEPPAALAALEDGARLHEEIETLARRLHEAPEPSYRLVRVLDALQRTVEHGETIAEAGLRAAVRRGDLARPDGAGE